METDSQLLVPHDIDNQLALLVTIALIEEDCNMAVETVGKNSIIIVNWLM